MPEDRLTFLKLKLTHYPALPFNLICAGKHVSGSPWTVC